MKKTLITGAILAGALAFAFALDTPTSTTTRPAMPKPGERRGMDNGQKRGIPFMASGTPRGDMKEMMRPCAPMNGSSTATAVMGVAGMAFGMLNTGDMKMPSTGDAAMDAQLATLRKEMDEKMKAIMNDYAPKFKAILGDKMPQMASGTTMVVRGDAKVAPCGDRHDGDQKPPMPMQGGQNGDMKRGAPAKGPTSVLQGIFRSLFGGNPQEVSADGQ
jgi:hypothetical protein